MKKIIVYILLFLGYFNVFSQTVIAKQGFEFDETWEPTTFSVVPCNSNKSIWDYRTSFAGQSPTEGDWFWGIRNLDGNCGSGTETISLPNVNVSSYSNVSFSFDYFAVGFEGGDNLKYELFFDNISQGEVLVVNGNNTSGWTTASVNIPSSVTNVRVILSASNNARNDRAGFDNIRLESGSNGGSGNNDTCANASSLTVYSPGQSSGNETPANTENATPSIMSNTSCDSFTSNDNLDLFYTFTVPAGQTSINVLTGGDTGGTINVAVWDTCNGNELICQNNDDSFHQLTGLTSGQTYILQVWHDDFNAGAFTIALESPSPPPSNDDCFNATTLIVGNSNAENVVSTTNNDATNSGITPIPSCGTYNNARDIWFTAQVPSSGLLTVETLNTGSGIDTAISIYTGSCGSLTEVACNDDIDLGSGNYYSLINLTNLANATVYIRVWAYNDETTGSFGIVAYSPECPLSTAWNGSSWSNGAPNDFTSATINGNYNTSSNGNFESCNCTINNGVTVNVAANNYILVDNNLTVNGTLNIQHEGSLVMVQDDGTVAGSGTTNVYKTSTPFNKYDYMYWSSPTSNETIGSALTNFTPEYIFRFDNSSASWVNVSGGTTMTPAVGYAAEGDISGSFPKTVSVTFDGTVNTGNITTPIGTSSFGWNLIGNPYPSAIDADLLLNDINNTSLVNATILLWTHNTEISDQNPGSEKYNYSSNDYATYTAGSGGVAAISGGQRPTGFIASGQGFLIEANTAGNLAFNNSMRVVGNNNQLFRSSKSKKVERDRIWLSLNNEKGAYSEILVGYFDGATDGIDRSYDGKRFSGNRYISLYSLINDKKFAIQGKSTITDEDVVKLGFYSYVKTDDKLKISIQDIEGQLNNYNIYLQDNLLNITHDLKASDYEFSITEKGSFNERFELKFNKSNTVLATNDNELNKENLIVAYQDNKLVVSTKNGAIINNFKAYDILGKLIINETPSKNKFNVGINNISAGTVLLINTELENNQKITKKILLY